MSRCPFATWKPVAASGKQPAIRPTQLIFHSSTAPRHTSGSHGTLEWHFDIDYDGSLWQFMDTGERADANYTANRRPDGTGAISVETASNHDATDPWTPEQLATMARLARWAYDQHGIPMVLCEGPKVPGVGFHTMWGAPGPWTPVAKSCPGPTRKRQFPVFLQSLKQPTTGGVVTDPKASTSITQGDLDQLVERIAQRVLSTEIPDLAAKDDSIPVRQMLGYTRRHNALILQIVARLEKQVADLAAQVTALPPTK